MQIWKLSSGNVVVAEDGLTQVLTPPTGVSYDITQHRWVVWLADGEKDWVREYFPVKTVGVVKALEQAAHCRELSLSFLLNRRMLPRIRRGYNIKVVGGLYAVYDPLEKRRVYFDEMKHAVAFNLQAVDSWLKQYAYDYKKMVQIRTQLDLDFEPLMERVA